MNKIRQYILECFDPNEYNDILHIVNKYKITENTVELYSGTVPGDGSLVSVPKSKIIEYLDKDHNNKNEIRHTIPEDIKDKILKDI